jgi:hypothetical protein
MLNTGRVFGLIVLLSGLVFSPVYSQTIEERCAIINKYQLWRGITCTKEKVEAIQDIVGYGEVADAASRQEQRL